MKNPSRSAVWPGVCLVALGLLFPSVGAAAWAHDAREAIATIGRLYDDLEYEQAWMVLQSARSMPRGPDEEALLSLYEGILLCEKGQFDSAEIAFKTALMMRPQVDQVERSVRVAPKIHALFASIQKEREREFLARDARLQKELIGEEPVSEEEVAEPLPLVVPVAPGVLAVEGRAPVRVAARPTETRTSRLVQPVLPVAVTEARTASGSPRMFSFIPAAAGVLLAAGGGYAWWSSRESLNQLRTRDSSIQSMTDVRRVVSAGQSRQLVGGLLLGAGSAALLSAAGMYFFGGTPRPALSLGVGPQGASAFVQGEWP